MTKGTDKRIKTVSILNQIEKANSYMNNENYEGAAEIYESLLCKIYDEYKSDKAEIYYKLGSCYQQLKQTYKAIDAYTKSLDYGIVSDDGQIYKDLGHLYCDVDLDKSIEYYLKGLSINTDVKHFVDLAFLIVRNHRYSQKKIKEIVERFVDILRPQILNGDKPYTYDKKTFDKNKKLKIGYLSSDLYCHAMMEFMLPIFESHNQKKFDIYLYSCSNISDNTTKRIKDSIKNFVDCFGLSYKDIAEKIHNDNIDILIDISGYTHHAIWTLLYKPAPVIIQYLGYLGTYGMKEVDYILTDEFIIPKEMARYYTEKPLYLDYGINRFTFNTKNQRLENITPLPYDTNGYVTFGSFNSIAKISPYTVYLWSKALKALPNSKLLIYRTQMKDVDIERFKRQFKENGVGEDRLIFDNTPMPANYLSAYMSCDVALDPSSFSGLTITIEQAFMGIPTITMPWEIISSRGAAEVNYAFGLDYLVANSEEEFVKIASEMEENIDYIRWLRNNLRQIASKSPICNDYKKYTEHIEKVYRSAWNDFCC